MNKEYGLVSSCRSIFSYESELAEFLDNNGIYYEQSNKDIIKPYELDIVMPNAKLAIEIDGLYWHNELYKDQNYHKKKTELCDAVGYQLIHIFEDEWLEKPEMVKRMLLHKLGANNETKVYARQCSINLVGKEKKQEFYTENHIQGDAKSTVDLGLYHDYKLVACLSFKTCKDCWDLVRYATNCNVVGGFSKLLKYFCNNYDWSSIVTFADRRWSNGALYFQTGFEHVKTLKPDYFYVEDYSRFHKFNFRHIHLKKKLPHYDPKLTEHQNCYNNAYYRIFDAGKMKFELANDR